ncbi:S8 family peptidase [Actinokineospora enzanensis]|uniref:S8 family peptidase n=1 Tax=Actinokineospora enzanensis TaxID=155975 RepID=UPI0005260596|nr:S8 family peptidase [Actinokineospora enzanensis]
MTYRRGAPLAVLVVTLAASAVVVPPIARAAPGRPARDTEITLVTGDHVTVGDGPARVRPAAGRERLAFTQRVDEHGDLHVVPVDAAAAVASGRVDARLFDVTALVRDGYTAGTPVIVTYPGARLAATPGARQLPSVDGEAFTVTGSEFWVSARSKGLAADRAGVGRIWLDARDHADLDRSVPQIGGPQAWQAGHTGRGVTVAVLDTGIDATHPDLAGAVADTRNFTESPTTDDLFGHGTHVASIITGSGRYRGVAPDSTLLVGKVLDDQGEGSDSAIIAGMEWAAAAGADVVNMSLGNARPSAGDDPLSQAVNRLTAQYGTLFVVSSGNFASLPVGSPAAADAALTVGAVDRQDALADFSTQGPRPGDGAIKPDITAPGVGIVAARAAHGTIGDPVDATHVALSGTSMAAPHVAGSAALLAGEHPDWGPERIKATLMDSASPNPTVSVFAQGAGRVDVGRATRQPVSASVGSLSLGTASWPHQDDQPITRAITYHNDGDAPVTLTIAPQVTGPGDAAATGLVTLSADRVTIPAGGRSEVTVTVDTRVAAPDGDYRGAIVATGGDSVVRTALALTKESEHYNVTVRFRDRTGAPTTGYDFRFTDLDDDTGQVGGGEADTVVLRLRPGGYFVDARVYDENYEHIAAFYEPAFVVTGDRTLVLDASRGQPAGLRVERPEAVVDTALVGMEETTSRGNVGEILLLPDFDGVSVVPSVTSAPGKARFKVAAALARPDRSGGFRDSPYLYTVGWDEDGRVPDRPDRLLRDRDLPHSRLAAAASAAGARGRFFDMSDVPLPGGIDLYRTPDFPWRLDFQETDAAGRQLSHQQATAEGQARWNTAVFGPAFPTSGVSGWVRRSSTGLSVYLPLFSDQSAHHVGFPSTASTRTRLFRNETLVAESDTGLPLQATLPAAADDYRLTAVATRGAPFDLSTSVSAEWTFRSVAAPSRTVVPVTLPVVRFAPVLDDHNRARAGRVFALPVYAQRNGTTAAGVAKPDVWISYDDGATWRPLPVVSVGGRWLAAGVHPAGASYVSLRASTRDGDGNTVDQTIIHAYRLH